MDLSQKSFHARFYKLTYQTELPGNLCTYFWKIVVAFIILPFTWVGYILPKSRRSGVIFKIANTFYTYMFYGFLVALGSELITSPDKTAITDWYLQIFSDTSILLEAILLPLLAISHLLTVVLVLGCFAAMVLLGIGCYDYVVNRLRSTRKQSEDKSIVVEFIKAKKNKYCPQISWKNDGSK